MNNQELQAEFDRRAARWVEKKEDLAPGTVLVGSVHFEMDCRVYPSSAWSNADVTYKTTNGDVHDKTIEENAGNFDISNLISEILAIELNDQIVLMCGATAWPYTENNYCVLKLRHKDRWHEDVKGRKFGVTYDEAK